MTSTASAGSSYDAWGEWVQGRLEEGAVPVSASATSPASLGHICGFAYELELVE